MSKNPKPSKKAPVRRIFETKDRSTKVADGFENFSARVGVNASFQENELSKSFYDFNLVTRNRIQLEAAYRGSWIVGKMIDSIAEDMTKAGIEISTNKEAHRVTRFKNAMSRLGIWQAISDNIKWGRLYGGSIGVMQIEGQDPSTPLDTETIGKGQFLGIAVYDRWQLAPSLIEVIEEGPDKGLPLFYNIVTNLDVNDPLRHMEVAQNSTGQIQVHHSRCIQYRGIKLPFFQAITEMMWGESELERIWDRLLSFDNTTMSAANLVFRANLRSVGIAGLREILANGGDAEKGLLQQFEMMRQMQTNEGLTLIDKEDELTSTSYSFAGLDGVLIQFGQQLSGASDIPLVRLFGQSPAGLSATGESDMRMYYDGINQKQESRLRNPVEKIIKVLWQSTFGSAVPKDLEFTFAPLWQMTPKDKADIAKTDAENVTGVYEAGLIKKSTAMKELRQNAGDTGRFTNITDEDIAEAELEDDEEPPMPNVNPSAEKVDPDGKSPIPKTTDSIAKKLRSLFGIKDAKSNEELQTEIDKLLEEAEKKDDQNNHHEAERLRQKARELEKQKRKK